MTYQHTQSLDRIPDAVFAADPFAEAWADVTPSAPAPEDVFADDRSTIERVGADTEGAKHELE